VWIMVVAIGAARKKKGLQVSVAGNRYEVISMHGCRKVSRF
jgi:hypothetical protein